MWAFENCLLQVPTDVWTFTFFLGGGGGGGQMGHLKQKLTINMKIGISYLRLILPPPYNRDPSPIHTLMSDSLA